MFVLLNNFYIKNREISFQYTSNASLREIFYFSFYRKLRLDYILICLFGFSFVWSESTLNSIMSNLSRDIPSIAVELTQRVDGKGASYYEAANLILVTLIPVIAGIIIWEFVYKKYRRISGNG